MPKGHSWPLRIDAKRFRCILRYTQRPLLPRGAGDGARGAGAGGSGGGDGREEWPETGALVPAYPRTPPCLWSSNPRDPGEGGDARAPRLMWPRGTPSPASPRAFCFPAMTPPSAPSRKIRRVGSPNLPVSPATGLSWIRGTRPCPPVGGRGGFQPSGGRPNVGTGTHWAHRPGCQHQPAPCAKFQLP
jgi:hypothetical protein